MWKGYENALAQYHNIAIEEWIKRGFRNNMKYLYISKEIIYPCWLGNKNFQASHKSNLLRKNKEFYSKYGWTETDNLAYMWPVN